MAKKIRSHSKQLVVLAGGLPSSDLLINGSETLDKLTSKASLRIDEDESLLVPRGGVRASLQLLGVYSAAMVPIRREASGRGSGPLHDVVCLPSTPMRHAPHLD